MAKTDPDKRPWAATRQELAEALGQIDGLLPGSVAVRHMRCGKLGCACKADPPTLHGPYIQWTRTVKGKTVTRYLNQDDSARYQSWFDTPNVSESSSPSSRSPACPPMLPHGAGTRRG